MVALPLASVRTPLKLLLRPTPRYESVLSDFQVYGAPVLLSEFGCDEGDFATRTCPFLTGGRDFSQVRTVCSNKFGGWR